MTEKEKIKKFKNKVNSLLNDPNFIKLAETLKEQRKTKTNKNGNKSTN
jgi:cytochrome c553